MWFRLGVAYSSSTSGTLAQGDVAVQASWVQTAMVARARTVQLNANDTGDRFQVLNGWFPAIWFGKVKAAYVANGITGGSNLRFRTAYRTATTSVEDPSAWTTLGSYINLSSGNSETNTGELTPTSITDMWVQIGIVYNLSTGTTQTTATLRALVSTRT